VSDVTKVGIAPTSSDVSSAVATVVGAHPDMVYIDAPAACPAILSSLKQLGSTAKIFGIDPCTSPPAIAGANGGANGLYFGSATLDPYANTTESNLYLAVLKKYAPKNIILDSPATIGFQTVIDVQAALAKFTTADLTTDKILAAFRTGTAEHNFMGHDYLCDGKALVKESAQCNAYQQIRQVKGKVIAVATPDYITPAAYFQG
jgi:branched-chain amino acid transport system substrate-binding protein